ncbi:probable membrane-associated kinase regulator 5 [Hibiscus syriacus]|uniref:probable membrane-associated kinase regulator 5 n=1 Tax=Hibiscus syriacus TaxID=106335 RepID=UPI00192287E7|nr:probable membrane-associated kinase regulator 5 [Hibiscus syriacus]
MEALNFLRFWKNGYGVHRVNQTHPCNGNGGATTTTTTTTEVSDHEFDEGDDGFIDLQFPLHGVKFRVFTPKKPKPEATKHEKHFTRENSSRKTNGKTDDSSKRSSKDLVHKCLNVIKPLSTRISIKNSQREKVGISGDSPLFSPATAYSTKEKQGNTRGTYKHLEKSKSSSAAASPINRRDDSLLLQHDGIQSAILHCKRSFNSSRESSWLSRCPSDPSSQDKLSNASSTGVASNCARTSSDEGNVLST